MPTCAPKAELADRFGRGGSSISARSSPNVCRPERSRRWCPRKQPSESCRLRLRGDDGRGQRESPARSARTAISTRLRMPSSVWIVERCASTVASARGTDPRSVGAADLSRNPKAPASRERKTASFTSHAVKAITCSIHLVERGWPRAARFHWAWRVRPWRASRRRTILAHLAVQDCDDHAVEGCCPKLPDHEGDQSQPQGQSGTG